LPGKLFYTGTQPSSKLVLNMPRDQRSHCHLGFPSSRMNLQVNPGQIPVHDVRFTIPANAITRFEYSTPDYKAIVSEFQIPEEDLRRPTTHKEVPLARLALTTHRAYVMTSAIPQLSSQELTDSVKASIARCTARSSSLQTLPISIALRHSGALT
jgi:hypothetical protein